MSDDQMPGGDLPQRVRERLEFVEFRLFWEGSIIRNDLVARFGISKPQATLDLREYQRLAPQNISYNVTDRHYVPTATFSPRLWTPSPSQYISLLEDRAEGKDCQALGFLPPTASLPCFRRAVKTEVLREIVRALQKGERIEITYQSPKSPESTSRWVYPKVLVHALNRWHIRTYCHMRKGFRSFVLGRILKITGREAETEQIPKDIHWEALVDVVFVPSPGLPGSAAKIIEQDYAMDGGRATIQVRRALLEYFLIENSLLESRTAEPGERAKIRPDNGQVAIENVQTVQRELQSLRQS